MLEIISTRNVLDHPWEKVDIERVATPDGDEFEYLVSTPNDFVIIVPVIQNKYVLMVRQYKHGAKKRLLGFPAGYIESHERPKDCAKRELEEETGIRCDDMRLLATLSENPTRCRNRYYIYKATVAKPANQTEEVENDDRLEGNITREVIPIDSLFTNKVLYEIEAGPMLSVLPFLQTDIKDEK